MSLELFSTLIQVFCTLAVLSFLYKDNPIYKFAEHLFVGVATGWFIIVQFHDVFVSNLWVPLLRGLRGEPASGVTGLPWPTLFIPFALGLLLFMRLSPKATYLARWSMAVIVGTYSGLAVIGFASGDLFTQIKSGLIPAFAPGSLAALASEPGLRTLLEALRNPVLIVGLITVLIYFFFSVPHKGVVGGLSLVGVWFLMVSFGASYGNTVMARISLFIGRATFLFKDQTGEVKHWPLTLVVAVVISLFLAIRERLQRRLEPGT